MRNRMYGGVRGRKTKVGRKLLRFPPTRLFIVYLLPSPLGEGLGVRLFFTPWRGVGGEAYLNPIIFLTSLRVAAALSRALSAP